MKLSRKQQRRCLPIDPQVLMKLLNKVSTDVGLGVYAPKFNSEAPKAPRKTRHKKQPTFNNSGKVENETKILKPSEQILSRTKLTKKKTLIENISEELYKAILNKRNQRGFNVYAASRNSQSMSDYTMRQTIAIRKVDLIKKQEIRRSLPPLQSDHQRNNRAPQRVSRKTLKSTSYRFRPCIKENTRQMCVVGNWVADQTTAERIQPDLDICSYMQNRPIRGSLQGLMSLENMPKNNASLPVSYRNRYQYLDQ